MRQTSLFVLGGLAALAATSAAQAVFITGTAPSGLSASASFDLLNATTLQVRLRNTSTAVPSGFDGAASLLTGVSWDFGAPGNNAMDVTIVGGSVVIGATSQTINFDTGSYGPGTNVGGEWGYSNAAQSGLLNNYVSALQAGTTAFGGPDLDGPAVLDGPQGGLAANPLTTSLGGIGAIQDEIVITMNLSGAVSNLNFLSNLVRFEFGSDAAFITVPTPGAGALALLSLGTLVARRRR